MAPDAPTTTPSQPATVRIDVRTLRAGLPAAGGDVPVLVRLVAVDPSETTARSPVDLSLVVDRSGSMAGTRMEAARQGVHDAIDLLEDGDGVAIVAFDQQTELIHPYSVVGNDRGPIHAAVERMAGEGNTDLHRGWAEGARQLVDTLSRTRSASVILLTDGHTNAGETDPSVLARDVAKIHAHGIATSTIGLGHGFHEDLLVTIAEAGGGRFAYAETPEELASILMAELVGAAATVARDVRIRALDGGARAYVTDVLNDLPVDGDATRLPDLIADMPYDLVAILRVEPGEPAAKVALGSADVTWTQRDGSPGAVTVSMSADLLDANAYATAEQDDEVAAAYASMRAARRRKVAIAALDANDVRTVEAELDAIDVILGHAPPSARVEREQRMAARIRRSIEQRDYAAARKRMTSEDVRSRGGFRSEELLGTRVYSAKRQALDERRAALASARSDAELTPEAPLALQTWTRSDGVTATLRLVMGDITNSTADAIVNPTNPGLHGTGRSVDGAVHRRGGAGLTRECRAIGHVGVGQAVVTNGHRLPARYVIHTASPVFDGTDRSFRELAACYQSSLALATQLRLQHVAFPAMGVGTNGIPLAEGARIALNELGAALRKSGAPQRFDLYVFNVQVRDVFERAWQTEFGGKGTERPR